MPDIRAELSQKNQYWMPKHAFYAAYHYALQYNDWKLEHSVLDGAAGAVVSDGMPRGSGIGNSTQEIGIKRAELAEKMRTIEETVREVDEFLYPWLIVAVTRENVSFHYLQTMMHIPCGRDSYYAKRRQFYYLLGKKLGA